MTSCVTSCAPSCGPAPRRSPCRAPPTASRAGRLPADRFPRAALARIKSCWRGQGLRPSRGARPRRRVVAHPARFIRTVGARRPAAHAPPQAGRLRASGGHSCGRAPTIPGRRRQQVERALVGLPRLATACHGLPRLATPCLLALLRGCSEVVPHSGGVAVPLSAQWGPGARAPASANGVDF